MVSNRVWALIASTAFIFASWGILNRGWDSGAKLGTADGPALLLTATDRAIVLPERPQSLHEAAPTKLPDVVDIDVSGDDRVIAALLRRERLAPGFVQDLTAAQLGDTGAALRAALVLRYCEGVAPTGAAESIEPAAAESDAAAEFVAQRASRCTDVRGAKPNEIRYLLEQAESIGNAEASYALSGLHAALTPERLSALERAAERGHARAAQELARELLEMDPPRRSDAYYWARRAMQAGDRTAATIAGSIIGDLPAVERAEIDRRVAAAMDRDTG